MRAAEREQIYQQKYNQQQDYFDLNRRQTRQTAIHSAKEVLRQQMKDKEQIKIAERH